MDPSAPQISPPTRATAINLLRGGDLEGRFGTWEAFVARRAPTPLSYHPAWLSVFRDGLGHVPYCFEATRDGEIVGLLPLAYLRSLLFGRFLVGLPYLNYGGVIAEDDATARRLLEGAIGLAKELRVRRLEVRHERAVAHPALTTRAGHKVHMRRPLPDSSDVLWKDLRSGVRNQVRKGEKSGLTVHWGGEEQLGPFYDVFSRNMRDLGTPVFGRSLFQSILHNFPDRAELCVVHLGTRPVAAALLLHGWGVTEVPSASSLRAYNGTCANMLMYWNLLIRAVGRGQGAFDFGRSTPDGPTFRFKKQWGAEPHSAEWQDFPRGGDVTDTSRENPRYRRFIRVWQRLPVPLTRWIGPVIVRGIP